MNKVSNYSPSLRALTSLMALWILFLVNPTPINNIGHSDKQSDNKFAIAEAPHVISAEVPASSQSSQKTNIYNSNTSLSRTQLLLKFVGILEYEVVSLKFFLLKVSFVFISSKGP